MSRHREVAVPTDDTMIVTLGVVVSDMGRVIRDTWAGHLLRYWRKLFEHAVAQFKAAAPLTLWLCFFIGTASTFQTVNILGLVGADRGLAAVLIGSIGLREIAMLMALLALAATAGAGFVTELGSMRVADEIDALEVMGVPSHPYLISTRLFGTGLAVVPLMVFGIAATFVGGWLVAWVMGDVIGLGSFGFYFWRVIAPQDFFFAIIKGVVIAMMIALVGLSNGYRATGGPVGVGAAVGRSLNMSIIAGVLMNLAMSYIFWGTKDTVSL